MATKVLAQSKGKFLRKSWLNQENDKIFSQQVLLGKPDFASSRPSRNARFAFGLFRIRLHKICEQKQTNQRRWKNSNKMIAIVMMAYETDERVSNS